MAASPLPAGSGPVYMFPSRIGEFVVHGELGSGSSGIVYLAEQDWPARPVALKLLWNGLATTLDRFRFDLETAALAKLTHPGIAHLYQAGTVHVGGVEHAFLAMERVEGVPLRDWNRAQQPDLATRTRCLIDICLAIEAAHRHGVVHRDLKPENILVEIGGAAPRPRVLDFGVAKLLARGSMTSLDADDLVGTLNYMSPEQARRSPNVDGRSDVYSLGAIAHELLTGAVRRRLSGRSWAHVQRQLATEAPADPDAAATGLPRDLQLIVDTAMAHDPARRYATPGELAADLDAWLARRPISRRTPTWSYRLQCFARRQRLAFASIALMACSLVVATAAGWVAFAGERAELDQALAASRFTVERIIGRLNTLAGTSEVRAETLGYLLPQVENCVRLRPDDEPALACKEKVLRFLGDIEVEAENWPAAADLRRRAEAASRALLRMHPDDPVLRADWATAIVRVGDTARGMQRPVSAAAAYTQAHSTFTELAEAYPDDGRHVDDLAWSCDRLASFAIERGDFTTAEELLAQRRQLLDRLDQLRPDSCTNLAGERSLRCLWSHLASARGEHQARQEYVRTAIPFARKWVQRAPNDAQAMIVFASTVASYVDYEHGDVDAAEARPLVAEAMGHIDRILVQEPRTAIGRNLAQCLTRVAQRLER